MSRYHEQDEVLAELAKGQEAPAYLVVGEEYLARKATDELVKLLVPDAAMGLNFSVQDGASPREVANDLATLPLFPGRKVVLVRDPEFLAPKKGRTDGLSKARDAWKAGRRKEGARRLLAIIGRAGWGAGQLDPDASGAPSAEQWREELGIDLGGTDQEFLREVALFCREERVTAPESDVTALIDLLNKGLPKGQVLVMMGSEVDPKNPLVKWVLEKGRGIEKKVASRLKDLDVTELSTDVLASFKKKLSPKAEALLKERVGGNMRLLQSELEKLALYVEGNTIEAADVDLLVAHARGEEFLELSDAIQKRSLPAALRYVEDALEQDAAPLKLLGAIASITRGLLESRERMTELAGGSPPRNFDDFKARVFPKIEEQAKAGKTKVPHPYAAFMSMQNAGKFSREQLLKGMVSCAEADLYLKGGGSSGKLVLERLLWGLCGA